MGQQLQIQHYFMFVSLTSLQPHVAWTPEKMSMEDDNLYKQTIKLITHYSRDLSDTNSHFVLKKCYLVDDFG